MPYRKAVERRLREEFAKLEAAAERSSSIIGLITLGEKCAGARSAGNAHAACEEAGQVLSPGAGQGPRPEPPAARIF